MPEQKKGVKRVRRIIKVNSGNEFLTKILVEFDEYLFSTQPDTRMHCDSIVADFGKSLGRREMDIKSPADFDSYTLFDQLDYWKRVYADDDKMRDVSIKYVIRFYRWLVKANPDHAYFADSPNMSLPLLFCYQFTSMVKQDYFFTPFSPLNIPYGHKKVCFIIRGQEMNSTTITDNTFRRLNLSSVTSDFYSDLIIEYIVEHGVSYFLSSSRVSSPKEALEQLYKIKTSPDYPNPDLAYINPFECMQLRQYIQSSDLTIQSKNNWLFFVRHFLEWAEKCGKIINEKPCLEYFNKVARETPGKAKSVPEEDIAAIDKYLGEKGRDDLSLREIRVIIRLLLLTELRISQICHLTIDCIHPTVNPGQYEIRMPSKTSYGENDRYVIATEVYNLLMDMIDDTKETRMNCPIESMKKYIFLYYKIGRRKTPRGPFIYNSSSFNATLALVCNELGIERYNATNFRDAHMNFSAEFVRKNNMSDADMSVFSHHKHIDTTSAHYLEKKVDDMLGAMNGITIGNVYTDTDGRVMEKIPTKFQKKEQEVQHGCGCCNAKRCVITSTLPCLMCEHFITTPAHEIYFKKAIEDVDRLIKLSDNRHEIEDLVTVKGLYVLYLKAIVEFKETKGGTVNAEQTAQ